MTSDNPHYRAPRFVCGGTSYKGESSSDGTNDRLKKVLLDLDNEVPGHPHPERVLIEALRLVSGARATQHGDYTQLQSRIAELWSAYLKVPISAPQVAFCMALLKVARDEVGEFNQDDGEDATAYAALWAALSYSSENK